MSSKSQDNCGSTRRRVLNVIGGKGGRKRKEKIKGKECSNCLLRLRPKQTTSRASAFTIFDANVAKFSDLRRRGLAE